MASIYAGRAQAYREMETFVTFSLNPAIGRYSCTNYYRKIQILRKILVLRVKFMVSSINVVKKAFWCISVGKLDKKMEFLSLNEE